MDLVLVVGNIACGLKLLFSMVHKILFTPTAHLMHMPCNNFFNKQIKEQKLASFVLLLTTISRHYYFSFVSMPLFPFSEKSVMHLFKLITGLYVYVCHLKDCAWARLALTENLR